MRAAVISIANPFDPLGSRRLRHLRRRVRVRALVPRDTTPRLVMLNGRPLRRAGWRYRLRDGDVLAIVALPRDGQSDPLRTLLSIALVAIAPVIAGGLLGTFGLAADAVLFGTFTVGQATTLGVMLAGSALVNALLPPPRPGGLPAPSPTYALEAQGNAARVEQAIPVQYGRLLSYPDFAAQPYLEYAGNEQYLFQLLCLGAGEYDVEEIRIEDTPVSAFAEIETEIVPPGAPVTLFPTRVVTSVEVSGQDLPPTATGSWSRAGTTVTITETGHGRAVGQAVHLDFGGADPAAGVHVIETVPDPDTFTVTVATAGTDSGSATIAAVVGGANGFVASDPATVATRIGVDIVLPRGLYETTSSGSITDASVAISVEARRIDDAGQPAGPWTLLGSETITDRSTTPRRLSFFYDLATPGRYAVRVRRTTPAATSAGAGDQSMWAGLRAYLRGDQDFGDVTLIAMRLRATNNISMQASRRVSVLATRKLPVWDGTAWSAPVPTRSIAWALADAARDPINGAGLPDARIDLEALRQLDSLWTARGDRFDGRFDQAGPWWDAASRIALAGRGRIFMQGGVLRVVRDGPVAVPVAMFSMRNIVAGSFSIDYLMPDEDTADSVTVTYFDATTWTPRRVTAALPGSTATRPAEIDMTGAVTDRDQALREAFYHAASNRWRRRIVRFTTEMEGFIPTIGDLVTISHDMPGWGAQAEVTGWDAASRTLTLSEPMTWGTGAHYVALRRSDGSVSGPWQVTPGDADNRLILSQAPDFTPVAGGDLERTHVAFGAGTDWSARAKVTGLRPRGLTRVEIEAVIEDDAVHTAESGAVIASLRRDELERAGALPIVAGLLARRIPGDALRAVIAWQPAPGADIYQVEMAEGSDPADPTVTWTRAGDTTAARYVITLLYAARTMIRVRGLGLAAGPWVAATLGDLIPEMWNTDPTPMWTSDTNPMWS